MSERKENRQHPRYEVDAVADLRAGTSVAQHRIQNLSLGGICLQTNDVEDVGTRVEIVIDPADGTTPLALQGEVVWVNRMPPADVGIRYLALDEKQREQLDRLIDRLARQHDERAP